MGDNDLEYYRLRAAEERARAKAAADHNVAAIHNQLADKYDTLAKQAEQGPTLRTGWDDVSPA